MNNNTIINNNNKNNNNNNNTMKKLSQNQILNKELIKNMIIKYQYYVFNIVVVDHINQISKI